MPRHVATATVLAVQCLRLRWGEATLYCRAYVLPSIYTTSNTPRFVVRLLLAGNAFAIFPPTVQRDIGIVLMVAHQVVAYLLFIMPCVVLWEKIIKTHDKPLWIRLPSRLPVCKSLKCHTAGVATLPRRGRHHAARGCLDSYDKWHIQALPGDGATVSAARLSIRAACLNCIYPPVCASSHHTTRKRLNDAS